MLRHFDIGHIERTVSMYWLLNTDLTRSGFNAKLSFFVFSGRFMECRRSCIGDGCSIPTGTPYFSLYKENFARELQLALTDTAG